MSLLNLKTKINPIRCLLLAAGLGTRLKPLTNDRPKCLVEVGGRPIIKWWIDYLERINCEKVIVNTHYHANRVSNYLKNLDKNRMKITEKYEEDLLGTAGSLIAYASFFKGCTGMLIHADNATDIDLNELIEAHTQRPKRCLLTMLTFDTNEPDKCGIVEIDSEGVVIDFHEKVEDPPGNKANGAVYIFEEELLKIIKEWETKPQDFSTDVLPRLIGRIYTHHTNKPFIDIGTPESLNKARQVWNSSKP